MTARRSPFPVIPDGGRLLLARARVPAAFLVGEGHDADADGLALVDIAVEAGLIAAVRPADPGPAFEPGAVDLDGGQVWPCFVEPHAHLDKGHIWPRARNRDGAHTTAVRTVSEDRAVNWSAPDVRARFEFALRCAYAHGTGAIRTHLDSQGPQAAITWPVFAELREAWRDRIALQGVAMVPVSAYATPEGEALARRVAACGGLLGGGTRLPDADPAALDAALDALFRLAARHGLDVDLHVDESGDPGAATLGPVARAAIRSRFEGRVTCGHCCSLAVQPPALVDAVLDLCAEAGVTIVSLPAVNMYLQDRRAGRTPSWRGVTLVHEMRARGIPVLIGGDNCRDPFFAFGDHDVMETFADAVRIAHLDLAYGDWPLSVGGGASDWMRLPGRGRIRAGDRADLVLFRGRGMGELLARRRGERLVLRAGRPTDAVLPDHRELDALFDDRSGSDPTPAPVRSEVR